MATTPPEWSHLRYRAFSLLRRLCDEWRPARSLRNTGLFYARCRTKNRVCRLFSYTYRRWLLMLSSPLRFSEFPLGGILNIGRQLTLNPSNMRQNGFVSEYPHIRVRQYTSGPRLDRDCFAYTLSLSASLGFARIWRIKSSSLLLAGHNPILVIRSGTKSIRLSLKMRKLNSGNDRGSRRK